MGHDSIIAIRPEFAAIAYARSFEQVVQECVEWLLRVLRPVDDPFFYYIVEELLADHPETLRLEVQSRIYQLVPNSARHHGPVNCAWRLD